MTTRLLCGCVPLLVVVLLVASDSENWQSPHRGWPRCVNCHIGKPSDTTDRAAIILRQDADGICAPCHALKPGLSHPSNVRMRWSPPDNLPLDQAGRITCVTCHYMHRRGKPDQTGYMIRTETSGREFCELCHAEFKDMAAGKHRRFLDISHLKQVDSSSDGRAVLDPLSLQCLGCHSGRVEQIHAPGAGRPTTLFRHAQIQSTHPISCEYPPVGQGPRQYHPAEELDPRIRLVGGKIGCGTCHEPYTTKEHGLVMENGRDELCLQCHMMNVRDR